MIHERVLQRIDAIVPPDVTHVGLVLRDITGAVSVLLPEVPKHGVAATLPRIHRHPGERPSDAVQRCLREVIGGDVQFAFPIPEVWKTPNSKTYYFASAVHAAGWEYTTQVYWRSIQEAREALSEVSYTPTRERNLAVLDRVSRMCLCPYRRVLEMVRELHAMGYERLRAPAYQYSSGAWRCPVVPSTWTLKEHGGLISTALDSGDVGMATYTGAAGQIALFQDYEAADIEFASSTKLAEDFIRMRPKMAYAGWGPDAKYAKWLQGALKKLEPHGLFHAFAEMEPPRDTMYTMFTPVESIKKPPGGLSSQAEWEAFASDHRSKGPV